MSKKLKFNFGTEKISLDEQYILGSDSGQLETRTVNALFVEMQHMEQMSQAKNCKSHQDPPHSNANCQILISGVETYRRIQIATFDAASSCLVRVVLQISNLSN